MIFTTSKKNSNEIKDVLVKNFGLNLLKPINESRDVDEIGTIDEQPDDDGRDISAGEQSALIENRD